MIDNRVSIILVSYNSQRTIRALLNSILNIDWADLELMIIDNHSTDSTNLIVNELLPALEKKCTVKHHRLARNMGFCCAANIAIDNSSGEFLCLIDHDIEITPSAVKRLVNVLTSDRINIGAVQPKVINAYDRCSVDSFDINKSGSIRGIQASSYKKSRTILYCVGACSILRRKTLQRIGGFYDDFFVCHDVDFGWRLWLFGYIVKTVPSAIVYHSRGTIRRSERNDVIFEGNAFRNQIIMIIQNFEAMNILKYLLRISHIPFLNLFHRTQLGRFQIRSILLTVPNLRLIMKRRYFIQYHRKIHDNELVEMLSQVFPSSLIDELRKKI